MIVWYGILLVIGFLALVKGADWFVDSSSSLAGKFHISGVVIGLTIVAFGTSAPELAVSTYAAFSGSNEIALSNVVGSNIFNLLGVLGVCAMIHPLKVNRDINQRDFPISIIAAVILIGTCMSVFHSHIVTGFDMNETVGIMSRSFGFFLLFLFVLYMAVLIFHAKQNPVKEETRDETSVGKNMLFLISGLIFIIAGGQVVVNSAKEIAGFFGMSETLIGLTIVAVGTSLPEFVTSVVASQKGETGIAVGNVVGSNIFNILFILGLSATIHPLGVNFASFCDIVILIVCSTISYLFALSKRRISRQEGLIMILSYVAIMAFAIVR